MEEDRAQEDLDRAQKDLRDLMDGKFLQCFGYFQHIIIFDISSHRAWNSKSSWFGLPK